MGLFPSKKPIKFSLASVAIFSLIFSAFVAINVNAPIKANASNRVCDLDTDYTYVESNGFATLTFKNATPCDYTLPTSVTSLDALAVGGGGGGGGGGIYYASCAISPGDEKAGGGGGGGAGGTLAHTESYSVTGGTVFSIQAGAGGARGGQGDCTPSTNGIGGTGGYGQSSYLAVGNTNILSADGGAGGFGGTNQGAGGVGGANTAHTGGSNLTALANSNCTGTISVGCFAAGGGAGAGASANNIATGANIYQAGGAGGAGTTWSVTNTTYGGGGGGGNRHPWTQPAGSRSGGVGGVGGGGNGNAEGMGASGVDGLGGGGGGGRGNGAAVPNASNAGVGGLGGRGVVILHFAVPVNSINSCGDVADWVNNLRGISYSGTFHDGSTVSLVPSASDGRPNPGASFSSDWNASPYSNLVFTNGFYGQGSIAVSDGGSLDGITTRGNTLVATFSNSVTNPIIVINYTHTNTKLDFGSQPFTVIQSNPNAVTTSTSVTLPTYTTPNSNSGLAVEVLGTFGPTTPLTFTNTDADFLQNPFSGVYYGVTFGLTLVKQGDPGATDCSGKKDVYVDADDKTVTYGDPAPAYTYHIYSDAGLTTPISDPAGMTGLVCAPDTTYNNSTSAQNSPISISCSGASAPGYIFHYVSGTLTINRANQSALNLTLSQNNKPGNNFSSRIGIQTTGGSGDGTLTYSIDPSSTATGCSLNSSTAPTVITATSPGICVIRVTKDADYNYLSSTTTTNFTFLGETVHVDPVQTSSISSAPDSCLVGQNYVVTGNFDRPLTQVLINNIPLSSSQWQQTPSTVSIVIPDSAVGQLSIRLYNNAAPVLQAVNCLAIPKFSTPTPPVVVPAPAVVTPAPTPVTTSATTPVVQKVKVSRIKIYFSSNSAVVSPANALLLQAFLSTTTSLNQVISISVVGYSQPIKGSGKLVTALSLARAKAIAKLLPTFGVTTKAKISGSGRIGKNSSASGYVLVEVRTR